jgi:hypothetical protein
LPSSKEDAQRAIDQPGFRTRSLVIVTTLTDAQKYTAEDIADLFRQRWMAELNIRAIKTTLGFDALRCPTPEMVRKELWTALLADNLIRQRMLQAAQRANLSPRELSFGHALQTIAASWSTILMLPRVGQIALIDAALDGLGTVCVGRRRAGREHVC